MIETKSYSFVKTEARRLFFFILRKPPTLIKGTDSNAVCTLLPCQRVRFALRIHSFKNKIFSAKCTVTVDVCGVFSSYADLKS